MVNARPTVEGGGAFEKIGRMFDDAARQYPGSVWSLSIGWGCEALVTAADVAPVRTALANAHRRGIAVFDASGDTGGLECKGGPGLVVGAGPRRRRGRHRRVAAGDHLRRRYHAVDRFGAVGGWTSWPGSTYPMSQGSSGGR